MKKNYLETGKIVGTHGVHGMVRIQLWCDGIDFLQNVKKFYLNNNGTEFVVCEQIKPAGNVAVAKLKGVDSIECAEKYRNRIIYISRNDVKIENGSYFIQDIIGCTVIDNNIGTVLGTVTDVSATGANDVWHVSNNGTEYLVPVIPQVVHKVDIDNEKIYLTPLKGIFEDED